MFEKIWKEVPQIIAEYGTHVVGGLLFLLIAWVFARLIDKMIRRLLAKNTKLDPSYVGVIARTTRIVIITLAGIAVLEEVGVDISSLIAALGIFGFAIALGLRTSLSNFFTGMMIYLLKPYEVGDQIEGERVEGAVDSVGAFHTVVVTGDGVHVSVPNSAMWARSIKNLSRPEPFRVATAITVGRELPFPEIQRIVSATILADKACYKLFNPEIRVVDTTEQTFIIRAAAWCTPEAAWDFGNRLKTEFEAELSKAGVSVKKITVERKRPRAATKPVSAPKDQSDDIT